MFDRTTMLMYLESLFNDCGIVELRHEVAGRWTSGLFNGPEKLLTEALRRSQQGNLYTSLNPIKLRAVNNDMGTSAICNNDVLRYARLFFDFDVVRPKDTSSTESELCAALEAADQAEKMFTALGWPRPARAISGNGAHLQYRIALPNTETTAELLRTIYAGLKRDLVTASVQFDTTVRNPGRICCLYGSTKRKGQSTKDRPHRVSQIEIPKPWKQVHRRQLEALGRYYSQQQKIVVPTPSVGGSFISGAGDYKSLDAVAWFRAHGAYKRRLDGGKHAVTCPWLAEHSTPDAPLKTDTVVWSADGGWPTFHCSHAHCANRTIKDVMALWSDADNFCTTTWGKHV